MTLQEFKQWLLTAMQQTSALHAKNNEDRVRLESEYAAFATIADKLKEVQDEPDTEPVAGEEAEADG